MTTTPGNTRRSKAFEGVLPNLERRWRETDSAWVREELGRFQSETPCDACHGKRLKPEALAVKIDGPDIAEVSTLSIKKAYDWVQALPEALTEKQMEIGRRILKEIGDRLRFLNNVGLDYLSAVAVLRHPVGRREPAHPPGLQIGSGLTGVLYVLDEPSIGLHQRDNTRLLESLMGLRDLGNSVLVVEHDEEAILTADYVIDMGPAAGIHGGEVCAEGTPAEVMANPNSLTGKYLTGEREIELPPEGRRPVNRKKMLKISGRDRQQPEERHRRDPRRPVHLRHRGVGRRQVDLHHRDPVQGRRAPPAQCVRRPRPLRPHRGAGDVRQGHRHRPVAHRPHAALEPGHLHRRLRSDPRLVRGPAGVQGARLRPRPVLVQRQGRALRGLSGRRPDQDRDAFPARRLRHLRRLQGQALQPRDAGNRLQGQEHLGRSGHDGRGGRPASSRPCRRSATRC
jgi:hypothetical protein